MGFSAFINTMPRWHKLYLPLLILSIAILGAESQPTMQFKLLLTTAKARRRPSKPIPALRLRFQTFLRVPSPQLALNSRHAMHAGLLASLFVDSVPWSDVTIRKRPLLLGFADHNQCIRLGHVNHISNLFIRWLVDLSSHVCQIDDQPECLSLGPSSLSNLCWPSSLDARASL